ncbi:hypothetical protein F5Y14DRAFT_454399 [Nemania sp. NC0429]|nr:hypothetical protein F5Y14DRAFT_454399 [Nemania sp. NC0429]
MNLLVFLAMPLAALAAPYAHTYTPPPSPITAAQAPFAPGTPEQGSFDRCLTETHHKGRLAHVADMLDCLELGEWARKNNGVWTLNATTTTTSNGGDTDWYALRTQGSCALLVRTPVDPTSVGNQDVVDLIDAVHLGDAIHLGPIEEVGVFGGCQAGVNVTFWLRNSRL